MGGGTKFYEDNAIRNLTQMEPGAPWQADSSLCLTEVDAVEGRFLFFDQRYVHEGVTPQAPYEKYILRSDIMFSRNPPLLTLPSDKSAYLMHEDGELLAENGQVDEAIKLFRAAYKLSPALARLMGQSWYNDLAYGGYIKL